jgi:hypothetical protein
VQIESTYFVSGPIGEVVKAHPLSSELWEIVLEIFVHGKDNEVRVVAGVAIRHGFNASFYIRSMIASTPNICSLLSDVIRSKSTLTSIRLFAWAIRLKLLQMTSVEMEAVAVAVADVGEIQEDVIPAYCSSDSEVVRYLTLTKL